MCSLWAAAQGGLGWRSPHDIKGIRNPSESHYFAAVKRFCYKVHRLHTFTERLTFSLKKTFHFPLNLVSLYRTRVATSYTDGMMQTIYVTN